MVDFLLKSPLHRGGRTLQSWCNLTLSIYLHLYLCAGKEEIVKRFSFRLQTVLGMREKFLEQKQLEMARVVNALNLQIQKRDSLVSRQESTRATLEKIYEDDTELDIMGVTNYKNFLGKLVNDTKIQEGVIENTKNILKFKQMEVNNAHKEVKVLEKLKEKQENKFYQHYEYVQAKEIDDIASTRYHRVAG